MPDILIRGMEMPKRCDKCPFSQYRVENLYNYCMVLKRLFAEPYKRLDNCPLVELPPHGDLIDRDALGEFPYNMSFCDGYEADEWVKSAPVIVPSNKEESE